jgi:hypothetical protein
MRNLKLTLTIGANLRGILEEGAREGRSISNFSRRLPDRTARALLAQGDASAHDSPAAQGACPIST